MPLSAIQQFLPCPTPDAWLDQAEQHQDLLLIDHAHCEKKAAATAVNLLYRYMERTELLDSMSRLAREELRHFEQVLAIMKKRGIDYRALSSARYAGGLRELVRKSEPGRLVDTLIVGALIEARSCERFARLVPRLDAELGKFYGGLLASEARHFQVYLKLAERYSEEPLADRIGMFQQREQQLIETPDVEFRFHSGPVQAAQWSGTCVDAAPASAGTAATGTLS